MDGNQFSARVLAMEGKAYRMARSMLSSEQDCQDAWQQALLKAWEKRGTLRQPEYFETWVIRILIHECRNVQRAHHKNAAVPLGEDGAQGQAQEEPVGLYQALQQLPDKHQLPLILHFAQGYTLDQTARILGIPVSSVNWRLRQGKKQLRRLLGKEDA